MTVLTPSSVGVGIPLKETSMDAVTALFFISFFISKNNSISNQFSLSVIPETKDSTSNRFLLDVS